MRVSRSFGITKQPFQDPFKVACRPGFIPGTQDRLGVVFNKSDEGSEITGGGVTSRKTEEEKASELVSQLVDKDPNVRANAAWSLGFLEDKRAVESLIKCLSDKSEGVRAAAALALAVLEDTRAVEPLIQCLSDESEEVRTNAAIALAQLQLEDTRAVEPLVRLARDLLVGGELLSNQSRLCKQVVISLYRINETAISELGLGEPDLLWLEINEEYSILSDEQIF